VDPLEGYPLVVAAALEADVGGLYRTLGSGDQAAAAAGAASLLAENPGFHPAQVLLAQARFVERRYDAAREMLTPVTAELPTYTAAQLLVGRVAEILGDLPAAYAAYGQIAAVSPLAAESGVAMRPRALEILGNRLDEALRRGRLDQAAAELARLEAWAPGEEATLEGAWRVAAAGEDGQAALAAVTALLGVRPEDRELLLRRSELEFTVGHARKGVEILRRLTERYPEDRDLVDRLEEGKLRLRVALLPGEVQTLAEQPILTRGDYALLLYWLMPGVRSGRGASPRIATDILEHPHREAIAQVINKRLMAVDETVHRFSPERPVTRVVALESLLRVLGERAGEEPTCLGAAGLSPRPSQAWICRAAVGCRLIEAEGDCLPQAPLSGAGALEMMRRALGQLGDG